MGSCEEWAICQVLTVSLVHSMRTLHTFSIIVVIIIIITIYFHQKEHCNRADPVTALLPNFLWLQRRLQASKALNSLCSLFCCSSSSLPHWGGRGLCTHCSLHLVCSPASLQRVHSSTAWQAVGQHCACSHRALFETASLWPHVSVKCISSQDVHGAFHPRTQCFLGCVLITAHQPLNILVFTWSQPAFAFSPINNNYYSQYMWSTSLWQALLDVSHKLTHLIHPVTPSNRFLLLSSSYKWENWGTQ